MGSEKLLYTNKEMFIGKLDFLRERKSNRLDRKMHKILFLSQNERKRILKDRHKHFV